MTPVDRRTVLGLLAAVLVVAVACSVWFGVRSYELRAGPSAANDALADPKATEEVVARVSAGLKSVFSYDYANLDRTERAVDLALTGSAAAQYREKFDAAAARAKREKLVRVSTVRSIGVRELSGDRATLLVFLDQQLLPAEGKAKSSTATLDVTAVRAGGTWRIAELTTL